MPIEGVKSEPEGVKSEPEDLKRPMREGYARRPHMVRKTQPYFRP